VDVYIVGGMKMKSRKGFTLVELLAVISVLGILIVLSVPSIISVLSNSKKMLNEYDQETLLDAAKYYITDIDEGTLEYTYTGNSAIDVNGTTYTKGMVMSKYDAKTYIIENNGITITAYDLVSGGYYDANCKYAGEVVSYEENGTIKTSKVAEDTSCHVPKTCKIKVGINGRKVENDKYYVTDDYTAEIIDGCEY
jgi:prepilin-type N-terminal cleavage/methylation domain-containing protein